LDSHFAGSFFHTSPMLFIQVEGSTDFIFSKGKLRLRKGHACVLPAGLPHIFQPASPGKENRQLVLTTRPPQEIALHLVKLGKADCDIIHNQIIRGQAARRVIKILQDAPPPANEQLAAILALVIKHWTASPDAQEYIAVSRCKCFLATQYSKPELHIGAIASQIGCFNSYLVRIFGQKEGRTIVDYRNQLRTEHAAFLLKNTTMKSQDVSAACGFRRPDQFNRNFLRHYGTTPKLYRRLHAGKLRGRKSS
jgi:AraC-like DNA-binding protein